MFVLAVFEGAGVDIASPMVSTCGSGITAAVVTLAANQLLSNQVPVYDVSSDGVARCTSDLRAPSLHVQGSWVEWVQAAPPSSRI